MTKWDLLEMALRLGLFGFVCVWLTGLVCEALDKAIDRAAERGRKRARR